MNEVEKMYENAGIELSEGLEWVCQNPDHCVYRTLSIIPENCSGCEYFEREMRYPPFTADKQLELIKWLASYSQYDQTRRLLLECIDGEWYIAFYEDLDLMSNGSEVDFKECLAKVINKIWQDLTDEEKRQVKGILE